MLCVKIKAGLGNQMFQYAFGRALSLRRKEPLSLDTSYYNHQPERDAKRTFILDHFNIQADIADEDLSKKFNTGLRILLRKISRRIKKIDGYTYYPSIAHSKSIYYEGYWANEKYFLEYADIIRKDLSLKNPMRPAAQKIASEIASCDSKNETSVSLHIRRGDFVSNPHSSAYNGLLEIPYYEKALQLLTSKYQKKNIHIFIFSDDIAWTKENLKISYPMNFVSSPDIADYEEIILMSDCSHHIAANSTFSWWGAWLNPHKDKIVIVPKQWLLNQTTDDIDLIPPEWIQI
jgi:hypothetical protein